MTKCEDYNGCELCAHLQGLCASCAKAGMRNMGVNPVSGLVVLPEPAVPASQGVCCGNFTTGGHYMGQTEQLCCGNPDDAHPAYYTEQQVRDLLAAHAMPKLTRMQILAIVTAYEQGVGKGQNGEHVNPYNNILRCDEAWQLGYEEGQLQFRQASAGSIQDAARWKYAMGWNTKKFAVCKRVGATGTCWEPIKNSGPIDAEMAREKTHRELPKSGTFTEWCITWFGPESDESRLAEAVAALPKEACK